ncbi:MAG TPA: preprotein translocase subunit SecG [Verrucomicrobiae bacterium]|nr:preprotein translocase subunit SecG [Verrucomicrobiae bacterium]
MAIVIWLLTAVLVLDCLLLMLLVLIQLPKKEAGLGQAFGSGATDALFGAGSGNVLTKLTKYTTGVFFVVTLLISMMQGHEARARVGDPRLKLSMEEKLSTIPKAPPTNAPAGTNQLISPTNLINFTNSAAAPAAPNPAATPK